MNNNNQTLKDLIKLYEDQITELTVLSKIELGDDVIEEITRLKSQLFNGGETTMNNNPGNNMTTDNPLNMTGLREYITMYLDDIEMYGDESEWNEATTVLYDFMLYINSIQ